MTTYKHCFHRITQATLIILTMTALRLWLDDDKIPDDLLYEDFSISVSSKKPIKNAVHGATKPKIILFWTSFHGTADYEVGFGEQPFVNAKCNRNSYRCITTKDRNWLNESDAIVFHARNLDLNDLPPPKWRTPHQKFIFFNLESPVYTNLDLLDNFRDYFNITMTFRRDSDIVNIQNHGQLLCVDPNDASCQCLPFEARCSMVTDSQKEVIHSHTRTRNWNSKKKAVAWFVSNCHTDSNRELLVERLMEHIDVHIFGKCPGALKCGDEAQCDGMLRKNYRFYLSFENSLCPDYVTEKLYRPLAFDTVPIVFGGADYSRYLPSGSYINARNFPTTYALATHLKKIMKNDSMYTTFFRWKSKYRVDLKSLQGWCHLCEMLHNNSIKRKSYPDISNWWYRTPNNQTCTALPN